MLGVSGVIVSPQKAMPVAWHNSRSRMLNVAYTAIGLVVAGFWQKLRR